MTTILKSNLILLIFLFLNNIRAQNDLTWYNNLNKGIEEAKSKDKKILLLFTGSDWCIWCQKLDSEIFLQKEFVEFADRELVLVKIDFPQWKEQSAEEIEYNQKLYSYFGVNGYPSVFLLDQSGQIIGVTGYLPGGAEAYIEHLKSFLK